MSHANHIEFDFLPVSYRLSVAKRRRALVYFGALVCIGLLGAVGLARQTWRLVELIKLRDSLRVGLPILEQAVREQVDLATRLSQAQQKANQVCVLRGGVPIGWLMEHIFEAVPETVQLERIQVELKEKPSEQTVANFGQAIEGNQTPEQMQQQLSDMLQRLEGSHYKVRITGESIAIRDVHLFLNNLRKKGVFEAIDLETIDEVVSQENIRTINFVFDGVLPYPVYRLSQTDRGTSESQK